MPREGNAGTGSSFIGVGNHTLLDKSLRAATTASQYVALHFCSLNQTLFLHFSSRRPSEPLLKD